MAVPLALPGTPRVSSYGAVDDAEVKDWLRNTSFCQAAEPWQLLVSVSILAGKQAVVLCALAVQVIFMGESTMNCNPLQTGWYRSVVCEYTKAYVRGFPLLAAMASLAVFARMILLKRIYYRMLCRHMLLDLDNVNPTQDPLFQLVIWCMLNAFSHFFLYLSSSYSFTDFTEPGSDSVSQARALVMSYGLPTVIFVSFFWSSYDIEQTLVPLNKYWEENPRLARVSFLEMEYVEEANVLQVLPKMRLAGALPGRLCTMNEAFEELKTLAQEDAKDEAEARQAWVKSSMANTMWPAKVLLDPRIEDEEKTSFKHMWRITILAFVAMCAFVCIVFGYLIVKDFLKVFVHEPHQWTDITGLIVTCGHLVCTVYICRFVVFSNIAVLPKAWELWLRQKFQGLSAAPGGAAGRPGTLGETPAALSDA